VELESELLRKKHLGRFSAEEVQLLLQEMGFDELDLRGFRVHSIDGGCGWQSLGWALSTGRVNQNRVSQQVSAGCLQLGLKTMSYLIMVCM
jgi:hypothetical protein